MICRAWTLAVAFVLVAVPVAAQPSAPASVVSPTKPLRACGPRGAYTIFDQDDYEKDCFAANGSRAMKVGEDVSLTLDDGTVKRFAEIKDPKTNSTTERFTLVAYEPDAHIVVLRGFETFVAVDARTGREQRFAAFPFYAPGGAAGLTIAPNGALTVFETRITPPKPVLSDTLPDRATRNTKLLAWDSDRRARLLIEDKEVAFLVRDAAGEWHVDTIVMDEPVIDDPPTCMPTPGPKKDDLKACLAKLDGMVVDNGTLHSLRLDDGSRKRLVDDLREGWTTWTRYELEGYDPRHHVYVVHIDYYEGTGNEELVDTRTGEDFDLGEGAQNPYFSPDGKHLFYAISGDHENNLAGTELHLWDWGSKPKEVWTQNISDATYQVEFVTGWENDKRVGLQLADGHKAVVSQDDKGAWHYAASGTPQPPKTNQP